MAANMDHKIKVILDFMRQQGISVITFIEAYFASEIRPVQTSRGTFYRDGGIARALKVMIQKSPYGPTKWQTKARTCALYDELGTYFHGIFNRMLRMEALAVAKDPLMRMTPADVSPESCQEFSFKQYEELYLKKAPILFGLIRTMSCVEGSTQDLSSLGFEEELESEEQTAELEECSDDEEDLEERESVAEGGPQNGKDDD
jgi:hypothetical protein